MIQPSYLSQRDSHHTYSNMIGSFCHYAIHSCYLFKRDTVIVPTPRQLQSYLFRTVILPVQSSYLFEYDTVILPIPTWYNHLTCSNAIQSSYLLPGDQTTKKEPQNLHTRLVDQISFLSSFVGAVSVHYCLKRGNYPERLSVYCLSIIAWKRGDYPERLSVYYLSIIAWKRGDYPEHLSVYYLSTVAWKGGITLNVCRCIICPLLLENRELPWTFAHIFKSSVLFSRLCML